VTTAEVLTVSNGVENRLLDGGDWGGVFDLELGGGFGGQGVVPILSEQGRGGLVPVDFFYWDLELAAPVGEDPEGLA